MARRATLLTDAELDRQIEDARRHSKIADPGEPRATRAVYHRSTGLVELTLKNGCRFCFPASATQGLRGQPHTLIAKVKVLANGYALRWEQLDVDYIVPDLIAGRLGTTIWMRELARRGGSVRSAAKARAARKNGRKGGRPRTRAATRT